MEVKIQTDKARDEMVVLAGDVELRFPGPWKSLAPWAGVVIRFFGLNPLKAKALCELLTGKEAPLWLTYAAEDVLHVLGVGGDRRLAGDPAKAVAKVRGALGVQIAAAISYPAALWELGYQRARQVADDFLSILEKQAKVGLEAMLNFLVAEWGSARSREAVAEFRSAASYALLQLLFRGVRDVEASPLALLPPKDRMALAEEIRRAYLNLFPNVTWWKHPYSLTWGRWAELKVTRDPDFYTEVRVPSPWKYAKKVSHNEDIEGILIWTDDPEAPIPPGWEEVRVDDGYGVVIYKHPVYPPVNL